MEMSHSGLVRLPAKKVGVVSPSGVRISPSPPVRAVRSRDPGKRAACSTYGRVRHPLLVPLLPGLVSPYTPLRLPHTGVPGVHLRTPGRTHQHYAKNHIYGVYHKNTAAFLQGSG